MTATVAGIHLGLDTHANRPAANTVPDGSIYSCSTHSLVYKSNFAGNSWATWATLGGTPATLVFDRVVKTSDFSTSSATFVDVTGLSITMTTGARRVLLGFSGSGYNSGTSGAAVLTFNVDGTDQADTTNGIIYHRQLGVGSENETLSFTYMTDVLSAASHTFKVRLHRGGAGTATISGAGPACTFWAAEQAA